MSEELLLYNIGITLLPGVGDVTAKNLLAYCGSAETVFREKKLRLEKIPGIGPHTVNTISRNVVQKNVLQRAEEEIKFLEKNHIVPLFFTDEKYPQRLKHCDDGPVMLYHKGNADLNAPRVISLVGTRHATAYGKAVAEKIINGLSPFQPLIVSGLAFGIDIHAHRAALKNNLPTAAVLAHGLDVIYPAEHAHTAKQMTEQGGLLTEFISGTKMTPEFFPRRNRIIAGLADAVVVVESRKKGGSLITAEIANSYDREVFAVPGKVNDVSSEGCNCLIQSNKAALIQSANDIVRALNWDVQEKKSKKIQRELFTQFSEDEKALLHLLKEKRTMHIDDISIAAKLPMSKTATLLLNMEFLGVIRALPGKMYAINN